MVEPDAATLAGLLADGERLRVLAAVVLGATELDGVAAVTGLAPARVARAVARLQAAGILGTGEALVARPQAFRDAARVRRSDVPAGQHGTGDPAAEAVLRAFLPAGRLVSLPAQRAKRLVVLDHLSRVFEPGLRYPEREVNASLRAFHADVAALRRALVDEGFLSREAGVYWRSGGSVEV